MIEFLGIEKEELNEMVAGAAKLLRMNCKEHECDNCIFNDENNWCMLMAQPADWKFPGEK